MKPIARGIQTALPEHNRNQVKVLLSGTESEALGFIRRHAENESFLRLAEEIETARPAPRPAALKLIQSFRKTLTERTRA